MTRSEFLASVLVVPLVGRLFKEPAIHGIDLNVPPYGPKYMDFIDDRGYHCITWGKADPRCKVKYVG